jgi:glyoxylase-like metal-dependent hydrolase (beta-lactamase superfamily II)
MRAPEILACGIACAAFALPAPLPAQEDFSKVEIQTQPVAAGVHVLIGQGGNIGVSTGADGVMLIDDQYAPLHAKILAAVESLKPGPIRFVLNTHWHPDHTGGNELIGGSGALIVAHDAVRRRLAAGQFMKVFQREVPPAPPGALPVVTFAEDLTFHWNGDEIHVFHVARAHTDGDAIVHFRRANALHMGDVFVTGRYPFLDLETGGSLSGTLAAVERALALCDEKTRIIPGHGAVSARSDLANYHDVLETARARVAKAIAAGQDVEALVSARPLAEFDATWGSGFISAEAFLRAAHASLSAEAAAR